MIKFIRNLFVKNKELPKEKMICCNVVAKNLTDKDQHFDVFVRTRDLNVSYILKHHMLNHGEMIQINDIWIYESEAIHTEMENEGSIKISIYPFVKTKCKINDLSVLNLKEIQGY